MVKPCSCQSTSGSIPNGGLPREVQWGNPSAVVRSRGPCGRGLPRVLAGAHGKELALPAGPLPSEGVAPGCSLGTFGPTPPAFSWSPGVSSVWSSESCCVLTSKVTHRTGSVRRPHLGLWGWETSVGVPVVPHLEERFCFHHHLLSLTFLTTRKRVYIFTEGLPVALSADVRTPREPPG